MKIIKVFKATVSIPAVILIIVLIAAIAVLVVFQINTGRLNNEISDLHKLIAAEDQTNDSALAEIDAAQAENEALKTEYKLTEAENASLKAENDALSAIIETLKADIDALKHYQLTFDVPNEYDIAVDQRLEAPLIEMIKKHFNAITAGNIDDFRSTLIRKDSVYLLDIFAARKNADLSVTSISAPAILGPGPLEDGPFFLAVTYKKEGELTIDHIGVTKINKKWVVYDYD